ncbi:hypothetical protein [Geminocystis sp. NIES-3709]|uniref:hypothetical protein n=1 Tax=Geminocystis sp. NIES-3709 TaxID=1617448 RepID=UPI0005FC3ABA|nr:hypothetical protein [Geminocystis sp. NIES-3709]BAQ63630.1 hypothetical protein GM3709_395 [Geminocystis sp. NIES-3709]
MKKNTEDLRNLLVWAYRSNILKGQNKETGNTLIIAMSIGLLVLIASSLSVLSSSKDKTNAQAGEFTKQAMGVAELGVTRVHNFLAKNSKVAEFPLDQWATQAGTMQVQGTFSNTSGSNSTCSALTSSGGGTTVATLVDTFKTNGDTVINNASTAADFKKGGFKVTNYTLADVNLNTSGVTTSSLQTLAGSVAVGQTYGHGILTVEGQINPNATSLSNLFASNPNNSKTKIEVAIPLKKATVNVPLPGVWISSQEIGSPTNSVINATLLVPDCENMGLNIMPGNSVIISSIQFPPLPTPPSDTNPNYYDLGDIDDSLRLPRNGDSPIETQSITHNGTTYSVPVYKYKVDDIELNGGEQIKIVPGRKVILHLYGNIDIGGSQVIDNSCDIGIGYVCNSTTKVVTYLLGSPSVFRRENLQVLGYGQNTGGATSQEPHICLAGGAELFGFVFAPDYAVGAAGTGSGNGITGAVWARMFNPPSTCGSNTGQVVVVQDITDWASVGLMPTNIPPKIDNIVKWERKGN